MPNGEVFFHLDYLKITVFDEIEHVMDLVEWGLQEPAGLDLGGWIEKGPAERWAHMLVGAGPVMLLSPKDTRITYTMVELKGEGCCTAGATGLASFLAYLNAREVRWHGRRVDLAFDHVAIDPPMLHAAVMVGNFNSRCLSIAARDWNENAEGRTAYLGRRNQKKDRRLRLYDRRGFNRLEAEFSSDWASAVTRKLAVTNREAWPEIALGYVRGMVDFVDRAADPRPDRCPLLPWWAEFVGNVERIRNLPEEDRAANSADRKRYAIGTSEMRIQRCAKSIWPILQAFGPDYLAMRIEHFAGPKITDEIRAFAEQLKGYRNSGLAGLSGNPDEDRIPF